jgi:predicted transcriptional regulator
MSKSTTTRRVKRADPAPLTLRAMIGAAGMKPQDVASKARVGYSTVYRATQGVMPGDLQVWAIATAMRVTEGAVRSAIHASAKGAA